MYEGMRVVMTRGHYKNRPGIITEVKGSKCTVVLTDTPNYEENPGVTINNVTVRDYRRA